VDPGAQAGSRSDDSRWEERAFFIADEKLHAGALQTAQVEALIRKRSRNSSASSIRASSGRSTLDVVKSGGGGRAIAGVAAFSAGGSRDGEGAPGGEEAGSKPDLLAALQG